MIIICSIIVIRSECFIRFLLNAFIPNIWNIECDYLYKYNIIILLTRYSVTKRGISPVDLLLKHNNNIIIVVLNDILLLCMHNIYNIQGALQKGLII